METFISICAIIISIVAIIISSRDNRKQIMIGKIEEIYELTIALYSRYSTLHELYLYLSRYSSERIPNYREKYRKEYFDYRNECEKVNMYLDTYSKIFRLNVLANAYLKKDLKIEILAFTHLIEDLTTQAYRNKREYYIDSYKTGFPQQVNVSKLVDDLESKYIDEINMVKDKITQIELKKYVGGKFREKLGLRKITL
ncbi:hypothetical protein [Flavobacterium ginsengiterrae]|uniref:Phage abortive infection protein n=1 Tax=Flavobacterium ginsengiterrae TaxID=871695 RepID=A0ABP7GYW3_9FLAO